MCHNQCLQPELIVERLPSVPAFHQQPLIGILRMLTMPPGSQASRRRIESPLSSRSPQESWPGRFKNVQCYRRLSMVLLHMKLFVKSNNNKTN